MALFVNEPLVLFRNETGSRRFRRNVWQGEGEGGGRREGEGFGQWEEREGSWSIQSRKMGYEKREGVGKCLVSRQTRT